MEYLIRKTGEKVKAHIWRDGDTACRMWSTGGIRQDRYEVHVSPRGHEICHMCRMTVIADQLRP